jgi:uncharacterized protein DUF4268
MISKLEPLELRKLWPKEVGLTEWLFNNLDLFGEQIGLTLNPVEKEKSVGPFSVDILAEDEDGRPAIIENQLERTDHDHLGKVLTYLSNLEAKTAVWITSDPRPEHVTAIDFLNEVIPEDTHFFLVKVQAFKIGTSDPAPLFSVIAGPSPEKTAGGKIKKEIAGREKQRYEFFEKLLEKSNQKTSLFSNISPTGYQSWLTAGAGKSGLGWVYCTTTNICRVELFISGTNSELIKQRFKALKEKSNEIEKDFSEPLDWNYNEDRKQQYIRSYTKIGGFKDQDHWSEIQDDLVDRMIRLESAMRKHIKKLP